MNFAGPSKQNFAKKKMKVFKQAKKDGKSGLLTMLRRIWWLMFATHIFHCFVKIFQKNS